MDRDVGGLPAQQEAFDIENRRNDWKSATNDSMWSNNDHRGVEQEVGISHGSINAILSDDLKMRRVSAKFVPRQLTTDQMERRMMFAGVLFEKSTQDPTLWSRGCSPTTGDEDAVSIVAHSVVSPTKNFTPRQIQGKIAAHCIFWHRRCGTPWVRTAWTYC